MAARTKRIRHDDDTRSKIQAAYYINRLHRFIDGEIELSAPQVRAIELLLKKTLPDLSSVEMDVGGELDLKKVIVEHIKSSGS